jgi:F0F1-type ATP synthase assembly protein I
MICPNCGDGNNAYLLICSNCGKELQSKEELDAKLKAIWEELPPDVKKNVEEKYEADLKRYLEDTKRLNKQTRKNVITSALVSGVAGLTCGPFIIPDILIGLLIGYLLNHLKGGMFWGMILFGGGYVISSVFKYAIGVGILFPLFSAFGIFISVPFGIYWGTRIEDQY